MSRAGQIPRWVLVLAAVAIVGALLYVLRGVLTPVFFAFVIAYMCDPVVDRLERWRIPRAAGVGILLTAVLGGIALFVLLAVPGIVAEVTDFARTLPRKLDDLLAQWQSWLAARGIEIPGTIDGALAQVDFGAAGTAGRAAKPVGAVLGWIAGGTASAIGAVVALLMVPVFAAYLLYDFDRLVAGVRDLLPPRIRPTAIDIAREVDEVLGQFVRGQLLVMLILAVLYGGGYAAVGVPLAVPIGIVAGVLSFIPYVGGAVALGLALLMCLLDGSGWGPIIGVGVVYTIVQLLESFLITPRVVGEKMGIPAVWVLFALLVGGELFGFMGVLLALPAAAVTKIFAVRAIAWYRRSDMFRDHPPGPDEPDEADRGTPPPSGDAYEER